jgi:hypothetical protein
VVDYIGNTTELTGYIAISTDGLVKFNYTIVGSVLATTVGTGTSATGNLAGFAITLQKEISKFNSCKNAVNYRALDLTIQGNAFILKMPEFEKETVKTLVQGFTVYMVSKLKENKEILPEDFTAITQKFNNILVILKLVRDDENECKQNLSNYHINQFKNALEEYNIAL